MDNLGKMDNNKQKIAQVLRWARTQELLHFIGLQMPDIMPFYVLRKLHINDT